LGLRALVWSFGNVNALADTLVKATPLLLVALGFVSPSRVWNIGGEGQLVVDDCHVDWFPFRMRREL
jgi:simple sugar transport system permease protein